MELLRVLNPTILLLIKHGNVVVPICKTVLRILSMCAGTAGSTNMSAARDR